MKTVDVTVQMDENVINRLEEFCTQAGIDISFAFNILAHKILSEKKISLEITAEKKLSPEREEFVKLFYEMRAEAEQRGFLTDEEIEFEIQEAKKEIREKELREKSAS